MITLSENKALPDLFHHPLISFDKTENITVLHTDQKTFRKPLLLFPSPTRVSVPHNRNLRPCHRFQLKTSLCDVHFKMAYLAKWVEEFQSQSPIPGWFSPKRERWIFNCIIRRKGQGAVGVEGKGCFLPPLAKRPEQTFNYFISFQTIFKREGTRRGLKNFRLFRHQKVILIVPDRIYCSSTLEGRGRRVEKVQGKER
ncbi:hypothetical protein CDAR_48851 [Caerostris darwini]|uniref:Uncharacterized protein n=1 Tax=Caerostris darwini TaxID=1538125 RepID=A0AAV4NM08_9ARAC|nr:hypothetical protein CDAR_48851 [Caerostris darwini]